jgi:hypothetical protein
MHFSSIRFIRKFLLFLVIIFISNISDVIAQEETPEAPDASDGTNTDVGYNPNNRHTSDKKLIIGTVMGGICGTIVISIFVCMLYKWFKARRNAKQTTISNKW